MQELHLESLFGDNFISPKLQTIHRVQFNQVHIDKLLEINTDNIPPVTSKIKQYAADMVSGNWKYNGDSIRVSKEGVLLDGQNRLLAAKEAKINLTCDLVVGLDKDVFFTIDKGRVRSDGLLLAREIGGISNGHSQTITAVVKRALWLRDLASEERRVKPFSKYTFTEVSEYTYNNPQIIEELQHVIKVFTNRPVAMSINLVLLTYHIAGRWGEEYQKYAEIFLKKIALGAGLKMDEALYEAHQLFVDVKAKRLTQNRIETERTLLKVWSLIATKGLNFKCSKSSLQHSKDDDYVAFAKPTEQALIQMLNETV